MNVQPTVSAPSLCFPDGTISCDKTGGRQGRSVPGRHRATLQMRLTWALFGMAIAALLPLTSSAQQINYNSFNTPAATTGQTSNACPAGTNILFCVNTLPGTVGPTFIQDFYPSYLDPNAATDGGAGSTNYALQVTPNIASQDASVWFAVPQDVADGFTTWYAVKINFQQTSGNFFTADGFAFVIQNAVGGKTDAITNSPETGSGPTVLGFGGGGLGYAGIDNSVALEMDTFYDSYDPEQVSQGYSYDDNHLALQSCGIDGNNSPIANSPAHLGTPNCLITLGNTSTLVTSPITSVSPILDSSAVYLADGNPHQIVMVYNGPNDSPANYLTVYLDAAYNPGTHTPLAGTVPMFSGPFDITQYIKLSNGQGTYNPAYVGFTAATGGDWEQHEVMGWTFTSHTGPQNFGNINVCPTGQSSPAPCNATIAVPFKFASTTTIGSVQAVTQGTTGLDFTIAGGNTCSGTVAASGCIVNVTFSPLAPGLRQGAVQLFDTGGNLLATTLVYGTGQGPAVAFSPSQQAAVNTGNYTFNQPKGIATDAAGNLYIADTGTHNDGNRVVVKIAPNGTQTNLGSGLAYPQSIAVDGAGDLFVADNDLNQVVEVPAGCTSSSCQQVVASPQCVIGQSGLCAQLGVAVDGPGNVFIASFNSQVLEVPANGGTPVEVYNPVGSHAISVAVDAAGDLYIADYGLKSVVKVPAGCLSASCQSLVGSGWSAPDGVAVDAAGDVFVADEGLQQVVEVPAGCATASCQVVLASGLLSTSLAVDAAGDVFADNLSNNTIVEVSRSQPPTVTFAPTTVGNTSSDSPRSVTLQNIGNQPLTAETPGLFLIAGPGFGNVPGPGTPVDCTANSSLAPGAACNISLNFRPQGVGTYGSGIFFHDNALNAAPATQTVPLYGSGVTNNYTLTLSEVGGGAGIVTDNQGQVSCTLASGGPETGTCSGSYPAGTAVALTANANGTSQFRGWGGACASAGTSATCTLTINAAASVSAAFDNQNFGSLSVCTFGSGSSPCSAQLPITFVLPNTTKIGAIQVVTQGISGLDFQLYSGNTCIGTVIGGIPCTMQVAFTPLAPGLRAGAVEMFDNNGNLVATQAVYGTGLEPEVAFDPGTQTTLAANLSSAAAGVVVDPAGNVFVAGGQGAIKLSPSGVQTTLPVTGKGAVGFYDVALDGAGNIYLADTSNNRIVVLTPSGVQSTLPVTGLSYPNGVKVDGAGNVFITDLNNNRVVKVSPSGVQTTVPTTGLVRPYYPAVDAAGDVFFLNNGSQQVQKVTPAGVESTIPFAGLISGNGLAVDAAGDVFVSDQSRGAVYEMTPAGVQTTLATQNLIVPAGLAVDSAGDVYIAVNGENSVVEVARSQPPAISFATTNVGNTSADSPVAFTIQNVGNQPLTGSLALNLAGGNFVQTASSVCSTAFPLAPGALCAEGFAFVPQSATFFSGSATFTDNSLNSFPLGTQTIPLYGTGATNGVAGTVAVPNVVGQAQTAATAPIFAVGLAMGTVTTETSSSVAAGSIISQNPAAGTQVAVGTTVNLLVSTGIAQPPSPNPLSFENNYFLTGDYVAAGVTMRGTGTGGIATGNIVIQGVPAGADVIDAFLYWETLENTPLASSTTGTFNRYPIVGQQIGNDVPNYVDGTFTGTIRSYRADVNIYLPIGANGIRSASGTYTITLPDSGGNALPLTEGASLVMIYRVLSPNVPLKSVVVYDGSGLPTNGATQVVQGFYDAVGGANGTGKSTTLFALNGGWNTSVNPVTLGQSNQYSAPLNPAAAYAAVVLSTPVNNSDSDGILDAWKTGPTAAADFHVGQPGYYDVKTNTWVGLPGAKHGQKDLFVQLDYMCGAILSTGACDPARENLFPAPDANGNDPLAMVQQAFATYGVQLHLTVGNAVPEDTCTDNLTTSPVQLCQFPSQPGVIGWKNSLEFSKLYPRNLAACLTGGDCTTRFPYGQKDSYHYVLFGHSLAIPAWNTRFGSLTSINVVNGITTIVTADRGTGINACPARITISGVLGDPSLNGVYNNTTIPCPDSKTIIVPTPGVPNYTYPNNNLPEPVIGLTSGSVTSISGYSDLGGADSAVTLGLWLTAPNQDMSKKATVLAGTLFHEIGHTLGLSHGGLYYDTPGSYVPTFEANCKPNYQSIMNYLFQLDGVGPNSAIAFSNQALNTLNETLAGSVTQLLDPSNTPATFSTSSWYVPYTTGSLVSPATLHCDGTPLAGESIYRLNGPVTLITPPWSNGQDLSGIGAIQTQERGFNDVANMDLRQVGATGGQFATLATLLSFGSSVAPLNIGAGGNITLGSGGTITLGSGGNITLGSGRNVTLGSGGTIALGSGGNITLGSGGNVSFGSGGTVTPGVGGNVTLGSGGNVTLGSGGTITLGSGGNITLGSGGNVIFGSGGTIVLGSGGMTTVPSSGGTYTIPAGGGTITLGSGGTITLGSGGNVTLGSGGTVTPGSGGNVVFGSGGNITLGSGGTITLGSGGNITLGSGGNVTLGSGGTITLGSGGNITLGSGGNVTFGSGGTVTLGSGGNIAFGSGGNVTLGSGGNVTLGSGGTVTLGSGGNITLGSGGTIALGSGGNVTLGSGGTIVLGSGGTIVFGSAGTLVFGSGGAATTINVPASGGTYIVPAGGGTIILGSGGNVTLGSGGNITLGSGGNITLGSGGTLVFGSGGNITLGSGGVVSLGTGGSVNLGTGSEVSLGSVPSTTPGSGGPTSTELTYETANSIVRVPTAPTETSSPGSVRVTWQAPSFGVVLTYTIYRSSNGATPIVIGSVSGVNGNPPATEFTDTNPDTVSKTVVYTITTTLVPDTSGAAPRQSVQSAPAVVKNDQSIVLGLLPSSVLINTTPLTVTATSFSGGVPNGLLVAFGTTGSCAIGSQFIVAGVSTATVSLTGTGSCTVTAAQSGTSAFNAANSVSGTFMVLPQGSTTKSQTITFAQLPNALYGSTFTLSATSSSGIPVSFTHTGPCTTAGTITGVGTCSITASAPANGTYSAATVTQSFTIFPAVLKVTAANLTSTFGQPVPPLTYGYTGFVNGDTALAISGSPALSTNATANSNAGSYPIVVATGSLAAANYSFLYVNGALTIQPANQAALFLVASSPLVYNQSETLAFTGGTTNGLVTYNLVGGGPCSILATRLTANSGTGSCQITATMAGTSNYNAVTSSPATVTLALAGQVITFTTNPPASAAYNTTFTVAATGGASGNPIVFTTSPNAACTNSGATYTMTSSIGTCPVVANQGGNANYSPALAVTKTVAATGPYVTISTPSINFGTVYVNTISAQTFTVTNTGSAPVTINDPLFSVVRGGNSNEFLAINLCPRPLAAGKSCTMLIGFIAGPYYTPQTATLQIMDNAPGSPQTVALSATVINPKASLTPPTLNFGSVQSATTTTLNATLSNPGGTPLLLTGVKVSGANSSSFAQTNNCGTSLAAGASCTIAIKFTPTGAGTFSANLTVTDNVQLGFGTQTIYLFGKAVPNY